MAPALARLGAPSFLERRHATAEDAYAVTTTRLTLVLTDVCDSTALFAQLGDEAAFRLMSRHFGQLNEIVRDHDGDVVKTSGDGILASFVDPVDAVRAALDMRGLSAGVRSYRGSEPSHRLAIRTGLHVGSVLVGCLKRSRDYYGSTVNLVARLLRCGDRGEIILSQDLVREPGILDVIEVAPSRDEIAIIKGFNTPIAFRRLACPPA